MYKNVILAQRTIITNMSTNYWRIEDLIDTKCDKDLENLTPGDYKEMVELLQYQNASLRQLRTKVSILQEDNDKFSQVNHNLVFFAQSFARKCREQNTLSHDEIKKMQKQW